MPVCIFVLAFSVFVTEKVGSNIWKENILLVFKLNQKKKNARNTKLKGIFACGISTSLLPS